MVGLLSWVEFIIFFDDFFRRRMYQVDGDVVVVLLKFCDKNCGCSDHCCFCSFMSGRPSKWFEVNCIAADFDCGLQQMFACVPFVVDYRHAT